MLEQRLGGVGSTFDISDGALPFRIWFGPPQHGPAVAESVPPRVSGWLPLLVASTVPPHPKECLWFERVVPRGLTVCPVECACRSVRVRRVSTTIPACQHAIRRPRRTHNSVNRRQSVPGGGGSALLTIGRHRSNVPTVNAARRATRCRVTRAFAIEHTRVQITHHIPHNAMAQLSSCAVSLLSRGMDGGIVVKCHFGRA